MLIKNYFKNKIPTSRIIYNQRSCITFYINKLPWITGIYSARCHYTKNTLSDQPEVSISENLSHSFRHMITAWEIRAGVSSIPAGVHRQIFSVVSIFLILLKVQLGQKLAGLHHCILSIGQNAIRPIHLNTKHFTLTPPYLQTNLKVYKRENRRFNPVHMSASDHTHLQLTPSETQLKQVQIHNWFTKTTWLTQQHILNKSLKTHVWKMQLMHKKHKAHLIIKANITIELNNYI